MAAAAAAVVRHLEHIGSKIGDSPEKLLLGLGSDVGGQEVANPTHPYAKDQRGLVARPAADGTRSGALRDGSQDFEGEALELDPIAGGQPPNGDPVPRRLRRQPTKPRIRRPASRGEPERPDREPFDQRRGRPQMIGVTVGHDEHVEPSPAEGANRPLDAPGPRRREGRATGVHQHPTVSPLDQCRIALPDVEVDDPGAIRKPAGPGTGGRSEHGEPSPEHRGPPQRPAAAEQQAETGSAREADPPEPIQSAERGAAFPEKNDGVLEERDRPEARFHPGRDPGGRRADRGQRPRQHHRAHRRHGDEVRDRRPRCEVEPRPDDPRRRREGRGQRRPERESDGLAQAERPVRPRRRSAPGRSSDERDPGAGGEAQPGAQVEEPGRLEHAEPERRRGQSPAEDEITVERCRESAADEDDRRALDGRPRAREPRVADRDGRAQEHREHATNAGGPPGQAQRQEAGPSADQPDMESRDRDQVGQAEIANGGFRFRREGAAFTQHQREGEAAARVLREPRRDPVQDAATERRRSRARLADRHDPGWIDEPAPDRDPATCPGPRPVDASRIPGPRDRRQASDDPNTCSLEQESLGPLTRFVRGDRQQQAPRNDLGVLSRAP